jgi:hypothetical protein
MTIGTKRARNWGKEAQEQALALLLQRRRLAYQVVTRGTATELRVAPSHRGVTLPFVDTVATLIHVRRGLWRAEHPFDGHVLASAVSQRDVIRMAIQATCR